MFKLIVAPVIKAKLIDSTALDLRDPQHIHQYEVFEGITERENWLFGLKLHLVTKDRGEFAGLQITLGNVYDRKPILA